eukprot:CAMPEP_0174330224 /NCGR_PEP_ID=MMETSP0810-20121108/16485_1 /TAXON_ID=73025 ORGANISM="Eutreptiella gymnastica-like, Strain CCMP1594" /NCGR_SAMPLE_ID=MMETSP0810 /ASSEMBLY_ACC=CAM_ASM_000659 /LENGTH=337 /DNA_ID=CAMNT_0015445221 /DNA_START=33 /DNA_END=1046 /DNA_ORIENTATION=-
MSNPVRSVAMWSLNVLSGVCIIIVNKKLMGSKGYNFNFPTCLCALHFLFTSMSSKVGTKLGICSPPDKSIIFPWRDLWTFTVVANLSIISLNTSLMFNSIVLYQISKLAIVPFTCLVEMAWYSRQFSMATIFCIVLTLVGMAMVSISELRVSTNTIGVVIALSSIVFAGLQQLLCRHYQTKHNMPSNDLLAQTALAQGSTLMIFGPVMDFLFSQRWVSTYEFSDIRAFHFLLLSCVLAMGVNFSQFLVLGKFSAVTFQLMGHLKTMLVLILGWYFFGGIVTVTQTTGMCLAIGGMVGYGYTTAPTKKVESADANDDNDEEAQHPKTPTGGLDRVNVK